MRDVPRGRPRRRGFDVPGASLEGEKSGKAWDGGWNPICTTCARTCGQDAHVVVVWRPRRVPVEKTWRTYDLAMGRASGTIILLLR